MSEQRIPPLPSAPVNFNVLNDALAAGDSPEVAAKKAVDACADKPVAAPHAPKPTKAPALPTSISTTKTSAARADD